MQAKEDGSPFLLMVSRNLKLKEQLEERDENPFYKFIRAVSSERSPDGPERYHECGA